MLVLGRFCCFIVGIFFLTEVSLGQEFWKTRQKTLIFRDSISIDTLFILPGTLRIFRDSLDIPDSCFLIRKGGAFVHFNSKCRDIIGDTFRISYRVVPFYTNRWALKKRPIPYSDSSRFNPWVLYKPESPVQEKGIWGDLNKNGSLTRGVATGNNQSLAVQSALNLQLEGKLAHDIHVRAAITDENIPLQPEGTQQNLQDFDKVFIEVWKDRHRVIAGDYFINRPNSYFLNIFKRAQGLQLSTGLNNKEIFGSKAPHGEIRGTLSGAIARGRFARNQFFGIEGKQGPYPLRGAENEQFIVVLSGTERVFIDGVLLKRGQEHDYVIDYNLAQITFTARQLITKDRRIVVEFEYSDRNYVRTMYQFNHEWDIGRLSWRFNIFSEQDSKNQPLQQPLTPSQKEIIAQAGDDPNKAVSSSAFGVDFTPHEILYEKRDTIINGVLDTIFVYSTDPSRARWRVIFTPVGPGNGDYMPEISSANGRVFRFVGKNQGDFHPVIRLITPKLQRMITLGSTIRITKTWEAEWESAFSSLDLNLLSNLQDKDNHAPSFRVVSKQTIPILKKTDTSSKVKTFQWRLWNEFVHENFAPFVRFRNVEFGRDWNLTQGPVQLKGNEILPGLALEFTNQEKWRFSLEFQGFLKGDQFKALRQAIQIQTKTPIHHFRTWMSITPMTMGSYSSLFARHRTTYRVKVISQMAIEFIGEDEYNIFRSLNDKLLHASSYFFSDWQMAFTSPDTSGRFNWRLFYRARQDLRPDSSRLRYTALGNNGGFKFNYLPATQHRISTTVELRFLNITNPALMPIKPDNSMVTRFEYSGRFWKNNLIGSLFYETGSGFEIKRTLTYLPVNNGQGTHFWDINLDYNQNGVADLDEFQPATLPGQGNYMRILINTGELVKTFNNQFNGNLFFRLPLDWKNKKGLKRFLARWSSQANITVDRKTQTTLIGHAFNPFYNRLNDTGLVSFSSSWRTAVFFNRSEGRVGFDLNFRQTSNRLLLSNGPESRSLNSFSGKLRLNLGQSWTLNSEGEKGTRSTVIPFLPSRNYDISHWTLIQKITFQRGTSWRILWLYQWSQKQSSGAVAPSVTVSSYTSGPEATWNVLSKGTFSVRVHYVYIKSLVILQGPLAFDIYDALAPGHNGSMGLSGQYALGKNLQLNLVYEGRFGSFRPIHNGSVQIRAFF